MKNIHIIPTDKPSRLYKSKITQDVFISDNMSQHGDATYNVNIYITSDEEIKVGDWVIKVSTLYKGGGSVEKYSFIDKLFEDITFKKIILTTDQDLIKDGVQTIDNDFLEWFVKNPSCEEVEIRKEMYMPQSNGKISDGKITHELSLDPSQNTLPYYKIIIPKQEQCTCKEHDPYCCQIHGSCPTCVKKQETLEEIAKEFYPDENQLIERIAFKRGFHTELDEYLSLVTDGKQYLIDIQTREQQATQISSLKIGFYYLIKIF